MSAVVHGRKGEGALANIIAVANQKGGVGKTTTNINLAACLAAKGRRVLTVDIDPQGNSTSGLGVDKRKIRHSIYDVLVKGLPLRDVVVPTRQKGLDIAPSNIDLAGAEIELVSMVARETILQDALMKVAQDYDDIFIDCPPSLGLLTLNALTAAGRVLVPIQCEYYALEGLTQLMNTVRLVRARLNPGLEVEGVVLTMYDARTNLSIQVAEEVRKYFKSTVYDTMIPRNIRLAEAPSYGLPITLYDAKCLGAEAYMSLADEYLRQAKGA